MHRLPMLQKMRLLLVRSVTIGTRVRAQPEMDVVTMPSQPIRKVEDLVAVGAGVAALVQMGGDVVLGEVALLREGLVTGAARELLDFEMHDAMVLARGAGVAKGAIAERALDVLALAALGDLDGLGDLARGDGRRARRQLGGGG